MKRYELSWAMFVGAALSLGQVAMAQDDKPQAGPNPEQIFKELDKDADGQITADEVSEDRKRFFERLVRIGDKNSDGKLSSEEFQNASKADTRPVDAPRGDAGQGARPNPEEIFKRLDTNGDGKLTKSEIPERARQFLLPVFERLGKEELTKEDLVQAQARFGGQPGAGTGLPGGVSPEELFKRLDANSDGKITLDEVPDRGRQMVERLLEAFNRGRDASISKEEFLTAAARFQGQRPGERRPEGTAPTAGRPEGDRPANGERRPDGERRPEGAPRDPNRPDAGRRPMLPRFLEKLDSNKDNRLSADELAKASEHFKELDENGDGQLDPRELMGPPPGDMFNRPGEGRPGDGRRPEGDRPAEGRPAAEGRGVDARRPANGAPEGARGINREQFLKQFDKNGDGKISLEEAPERMKENFSKIDRNGDGQIDANELPMGPPPGTDGRRRPEGDRPAGDRPEGARREGDRPPADRPEGERREGGDRPEQDKPAEEKPRE